MGFGCTIYHTEVIVNTNNTYTSLKLIFLISILRNGGIRIKDFSFKEKYYHGFELLGESSLYKDSSFQKQVKNQCIKHYLEVEDE